MVRGPLLDRWFFCFCCEIATSLLAYHPMPACEFQQFGDQSFRLIGCNIWESKSGRVNVVWTYTLRNMLLPVAFSCRNSGLPYLVLVDDTNQYVWVLSFTLSICLLCFCYSLFSVVSLFHIKVYVVPVVSSCCCCSHINSLTKESVVTQKVLEP